MTEWAYTHTCGGLVPQIYLFGPQPKPAPHWLEPMAGWAQAEAIFGLERAITEAS